MVGTARWIDTANLRTFYLWLVKRGLLRADLDPFLKMEAPPKGRKLPRYLPVDGLRQVVEAAKGCEANSYIAISYIARG